LERNLAARAATAEDKAAGPRRSARISNRHHHYDRPGPANR